MRKVLKDFGGYQMFHRPGTWDAKCIKSYLLDDQYRLKTMPDAIEYIVDVGAHIGSFSVAAGHRWPKATIHAAEPETDNFEMLDLNVELQFRKFTRLKTYLVNTAVGDPKWNNLHMRKAILGKNTVSHSNPGTNTGGCHLSNKTAYGLDSRTNPVDVFEYGNLIDVINLSELAAEMPRIDLLKLDCEGCEMDVLENADWPIKEIKVIVGETHTKELRMQLEAMLTPTHNIEGRPGGELFEFLAIRK